MSGPSDLDTTRRLSSKVPALQHLPQDQARDLVALLVAARKYETSALGQAIDSMIEGLPRPVRTVAKKIVFGVR